MNNYILAVDQGTTGTTVLIFNKSGNIVSSSYREHKQYYPQAGWVEHSPEEIWQSCIWGIKNSLLKAGIKPWQIAAIGITNQRETTILWDKTTSRPAYPAIVWQCRRTSNICNQLKKETLEKLFQSKTGLVLDPYFSATKIKWLLDNINGLRKKSEAGKIAFGTMDSWLIWKLTNGQSHASDYTNASRTLIFNIKNKTWDDELLKILKIPASILPKVQPSISLFGKTSSQSKALPSGIPIFGVAGDQQAALFGQNCFKPGEIKNTYGTGCFLVLNLGKEFILSKKGLITTLASDIKGKPTYALEGSIFIAGAAVQWLRDELKIINNSAETEKYAKKVKDTQGVYFVPAFTGLGAPYWNSRARGIITGLTRGANRFHLIRATLESIAYQSKDVFDLMGKESGFGINSLKVDGKACRNNFLMQFQADILNCKIIRPEILDTTAKGAAQMAGLGVGFWAENDLKKMQKIDKVFTPKMKPVIRQKLYQGWKESIRKLLS